MKNLINLILIFSLSGSYSYGNIFESIGNTVSKGSSLYNSIRGRIQGGLGGSGALDHRTYAFVAKMGCAQHMNQQGLPQCKPSMDANEVLKTKNQIKEVNVFNPPQFNLCMNDGVRSYERNIKDLKKQINKQWDAIQENYETFRDSVLDPQLKSLKDEQSNLYQKLDLNSAIGTVRASSLLSSPYCRSIKSYEEFKKSVAKGGLKSLTDGDYAKVLGEKQEFVDDSGIRSRISNFINQELLSARSEGFHSFIKSDAKKAGGTNAKLGATESYQKAMTDIKSTNQDKLEIYKKQLQDYLDPSTSTADANILKALTDSQGDEDLDRLTQIWENERTTECLHKTFRGENKDTSKANFESAFNNLFHGQGDNHNRRKRLSERGSGRTPEARKLSRDLIDIMNSTQYSLTKKKQLIKDLINRSPNGSKMFVTLGNRFGGGDDSQRRWPVLKLYETLVNSCKRASNPQNKIKNRRIGSVVKKVRQIKAAIKSAQKNYLNELKNTLEDRLLYCRQSTTQNESKACGRKDTFKVQGDFCYNKATHCANNVDKCLRNINQNFENREARAKVAVKNLNSTIKTFVKQQNFFFKGISSTAKNFMDQNSDFLGIEYDNNFKFDLTDPEKKKDSELSVLAKNLDSDHVIDSSPENLLKQFETNKDQIIKALDSGLKNLKERKNEATQEIASVMGDGQKAKDEAQKLCDETLKNRKEIDNKCDDINEDLINPAFGELSSLFDRVDKIVPEPIEGEVEISTDFKKDLKAFEGSGVQKCYKEETDIFEDNDKANLDNFLTRMDANSKECTERLDVENDDNKFNCNDSVLRSCFNEAKKEYEKRRQAELKDFYKEVKSVDCINQNSTDEQKDIDTGNKQEKEGTVTRDVNKS